MSATIRQIAEKANVSIATVDRVIHKRGRVKPETHEKIKKILEEYDYKPNIFARNLVLGEKRKIAVILPQRHQDGAYWELPISGIEQAAKHLEHYQFYIELFHYDKKSTESFNEVANKVREENFDGIILAPIQTEAAKSFFNSIDGKIPCVLFDTTLQGCNFLASIHQNSFDSGVVAAEMVKMRFQVPSEVAVVRFFPNTIHIEKRKEGFKQYLSDINNLSLIDIDIPANHTEEELFSIVQKFLQISKNTKCIYVTGAHIFEIAKLLSKTDNFQKPFLIGYDLIPENIEYLEKGMIDILISQNPDLQGFTAVYALYRHLMRKDEIEKEPILPIEIITKGNLNYFLESRLVKQNHHKSIFIS